MQIVDDRWSVRELRNLRGFAIEWAEPGRIIASRRHQLYRLTTLGDTPRYAGSYPEAMWKRVASRSRLGQRLLRSMFFNIMPLADGRLFLTFAKSVGVLVGDTVEPLRGLARPTRILRSGCAADGNGSVFFGEYLTNNERGPIRVYRLPSGSLELEVVHVFPAGDVRHVHGIFNDPQSGCLWCVTGDRGEECRIMRTVDGFRTIEVVGAGDETWRTVSLLFHARGLIYGSDAEFQQNYIYSLDPETGVRTRLAVTEGPVYYAYTNGIDHCLAVTAEGCASQTEFVASIWRVSEDGKANRLLKVAKDRYPNQFLVGTLHFPSGPGLPSRIPFHAVALEGDNRTFCLEMN
ncbi:MAG TPA: hypothetical protein VMO47_06120 [Rhodothermales bacterium]|nr:hypothetical protein [Rhodothermales bacterium]